MIPEKSRTRVVWPVISVLLFVLVLGLLGERLFRSVLHRTQLEVMAIGVSDISVQLQQHWQETSRWPDPGEVHGGRAMQYSQSEQLESGSRRDIYAGIAGRVSFCLDSDGRIEARRINEAFEEKVSALREEGD